MLKTQSENCWIEVLQIIKGFIMGNEKKKVRVSFYSGGRKVVFYARKKQ